VTPLLAGGAAAFLAEVDGDAVGFLIASRSRPDIGHVNDLYVRASRRGRGVARALLRHVAAAFRDRGVEYVTLDVDRRNSPARTLYDELGFVPYADRLALPVATLEQRLGGSG
jgi:ribosomal protein S18 acetylase RimI-like enzyme